MNGDTPGVWESSGPDGYVALIVRGASGRLLLRVEIARRCYSPAWVLWLERWARRWDVGRIQLMK